jgi:UDP-3-O-[3-hydroxymyristoyl] glucosamine N-acyltransferase
MEKLLVIGAGQHGAVVKEFAQDTGLFERIDFVDDNSPDVKWTTANLEELREEYSQAIVSIGNNRVRKDFIEQLEKIGYTIPILVHPSAYVSRTARVGYGSIIGPNAVILANSEIGKGCIISASAVIDHNSIIGQYSHINVGSTVVARSVVPNFSKVLAGTVYGTDYLQK